MKITIDVDCTPEEVRRVFGLPDVTPVNEALMAQVTKRVEKGFSPEDMDKLVKMWMGGAQAGLGELQKGLWSVLKSAGGKSTPTED